MVEQLGTHGSKHAGLGTNSETHGVPAGIFEKPRYRNTFLFSSLRTALHPTIVSWVQLLMAVWDSLSLILHHMGLHSTPPLFLPVRN